MNLLAMVFKEFLQIVRDRRSLLMLMFLPTLLLLVFGYVLSFDVRDTKLGVLDMDRSRQSRQLVSMITAGGYFKLQTVFDSGQSVDAALEDGSVTAAVIIPQGFAKALEKGTAARLQALVDGSDGREAAIVQGYLLAYVNAFGEQIRTETQLRTASGFSMPITPETRVWYNPELKSTPFLITGLMVFILTMTGTISTALSVVRERERGTMEQLLVSPLPAAAVIIGKTLPYLAIAALSTSIILAVGIAAFDLAIRGSALMLTVATLLFILAALGQGLLISTITSSQQVAFFAAGLSSMLPSLLLSGFVFPIAGMPKVIQLITFVVPARYYVQLIRGIMIRGSGFEAGQHDLMALAVFSLLMIAGSVLRFKQVRLV